MTALPSITLLPNKEESVRRFHPWIFSGAIASISGNPAEGDPIRIFSSKHEPLGVGHYEKGSIAVPMSIRYSMSLSGKNGSLPLSDCVRLWG